MKIFSYTFFIIVSCFIILSFTGCVDDEDSPVYSSMNFANENSNDKRDDKSNNENDNSNNQGGGSGNSNNQGGGSGSGGLL